MNTSNIRNGNSSHYDKDLCIGDFNPEIPEDAVRDFCDLHKLKNFVRGPACFLMFS